MNAHVQLLSSFHAVWSPTYDTVAPAFRWVFSTPSVKHLWKHICRQDSKSSRQLRLTMTLFHQNSEMVRPFTSPSTWMLKF